MVKGELTGNGHTAEVDEEKNDCFPAKPIQPFECRGEKRCCGPCQEVVFCELAACGIHMEETRRGRFLSCLLVANTFGLCIDMAAGKEQYWILKLNKNKLSAKLRQPRLN